VDEGDDDNSSSLLSFKRDDHDDIMYTTLSDVLSLILGVCFEGKAPEKWHTMALESSSAWIKTNHTRQSSSSSNTGSSICMDPAQTTNTMLNHVFQQKFSIAARTCCINSFILASQRVGSNNNSNTEQATQNQHLQYMSNLMLPILVSWGAAAARTTTTTAKNDDDDHDMHHPLCMAAALQTAFIIISRSKSFRGFRDKGTQSRCGISNVRQGLSMMHQWALSALKAKNYATPSSSPSSSSPFVYAVRTMRIAGLKLMLAVITIDQLEEEPNDHDNNNDEYSRLRLKGCLSPGELGETLSALRGAANVDPDVEIRKLASYLLTAMQA